MKKIKEDMYSAIFPDIIYRFITKFGIFY